MIIYHHIGGRNGTYPLPLRHGPLLNDFHLVLYDADENCFAQMKNVHNQDWGRIDVYPYCIGGYTGVGKFNLNFHPTTNSLYKFNEEFYDYNFVDNPLYGEYSFGDACKNVATVDLDMLSFEDALKEINLSVDYLSLDVQGAEYDIIEGAKEVITKDCIGIQLEVEFVKLYREQKVFADITTLMDSMGFELIELGAYGRCAPISVPIGFRGSEQPLYAEAVFLKKLDNISDKEQLSKAAFFALIYKKLGLCLKYLTILENYNFSGTNESRLYKKCLQNIWRLYVDSGHFRFPRLPEIFSNQMFQDYYAQKGNQFSLDKIQIKEKLQQMLPLAQTYKISDTHPLEKTLRKYQLHEVADVVKEKRIFEIDRLFELCGQ